MKTREDIIEEIKANFCIARDGRIEATKVMDEAGWFPDAKKETSRCIGDLCLAISDLDSELIKIRNKQ